MAARRQQHETHHAQISSGRHHLANVDRIMVSKAHQIASSSDLHGDSNQHGQQGGPTIITHPSSDGVHGKAGSNRAAWLMPP
ncbi:hypothetical protein ACLOJK_036780, partial [Asimina triloba]